MVNFLTKKEFDNRVKILQGEGKHWKSSNNEARWDYHSCAVELLKSLGIESADKVLEMGTMGMTVVTDSKTIDFEDNWDFEGKNPTYIHDARQIPWPLEDKQFDVFVALRVYMHLAPKQKEAFQEAIRIAKKVVIVVPETYNQAQHSTSEGIGYYDFVEFYDGNHPNLYIPTIMGDLYYFDTENSSKIDLFKLVRRKNNKASFYQEYSKFFNRINDLKNKESKYLIYGYSSIGKTVKSFIQENAVGFIDKDYKNINFPEVYSLEEGLKLQYDYLIISLLGREEKVIEELVNYYKIDSSKIIVLS